MFPQSPCESDYEYLVPVMHIDTARSDDWRVDYDGYLKSVPSFPQAQAATGRGDDDDYEDPYDYRTSMASGGPLSQLTEGAPPIPVRNPAAKRYPHPRNRPVASGQKEVIPAANTRAAVIAKLKKFNVRPPVVAVSPPPTVPPATLLSRVNRTPSSSQAARPGTMSPVRIAGRPSSHRPSDGPTQIPAQDRPTQSPSQVRPTQTPAQVRPSLTIPSTVSDPDTDIMGKDVRELSMEEVSVCLQQLKMSEHVDDFIDKEVDGEMLSCLDQTILVDEFHFSGFNAIKLMKFVNEGYVPRISTLK